jgi:hypothetical protein
MEMKIVFGNEKLVVTKWMNIDNRTHQVYKTNQAFTTINGPPYKAIISAGPLQTAQTNAPAATTPTPISL